MWTGNGDSAGVVAAGVRVSWVVRGDEPTYAVLPIGRGRGRQDLALAANTHHRHARGRREIQLDFACTQLPPALPPARSAHLRC